jgi:protein O-mannosyl-transferase
MTAPVAAPGHPAAGWTDAAWLIGIAVAALLAFSPVLGHHFTVWDDPLYVTDNPVIRRLDGPALARMFGGTYLYNYQPLTLLSYAIDFRRGGLDPRVYHATNLALHVMNCLLAYWLVRQLTGDPVTAGIAALLFAVHPLQAEAVSWISSRKDVLAATLTLGSGVAYLSCRGWRRPGPYVLSLSLFAAACLAKSVALTLPALLLLFDFWRNGRITLRDAVEKVPFALVSAGCAVVALFAVRGAIPTDAVPTLLQHAAMVCHNLLFYGAKLAAPAGLSAVYPSWIVVGEPLPWTVLAAPAVLAGSVAAIAAWGRGWRPLITGPAFYAICLLPVLGIIPAGLIRAADRYCYLASIGIFSVAAAAAAALLIRWRERPWRRVLVFAVIAAAVASLTLGARSRCRVWHDSITLFGDVVRTYPRLELGYRNLASAYVEAGDDRGAVACYDALLRIQPAAPSYHYGRGCALSRLGQGDSARASFDRALALDPSSIDARINRGVLLAMAGDDAGAVRDFDRVLAQAPDDTDALYNRGLMMLRRREFIMAARDFDAALRLAPGYAAAYKGRAKARLPLRDYHAAAEDLTRYIRSRPADGEGYWLRAGSYRQAGDRYAARSDSLRALRLGYRPARPGGR